MTRALDRALVVHTETETYLLWGRVLRKLSRLKESIANYRRAAEIEPGDPEVCEHLDQSGDEAR